MRHLLRLPCLFLLAGLPAADGLTGAAASQDDFDNGQNQGGWSYNPGDVIEPTGGNPGGWLHQAAAFTFAPIFSSQSNSFAGDYRAAGIDRFEFDARLDNQDFGNGNGFNISVLLRDTKGTPSVNDDDYAYRVGPNIPLEGAGWEHYALDIPSADTSAVPSGWKGGWVGDPENFRPGVEWSDVITSVDRMEIWYIDPAFFALVQGWDVGLDNVVLHGGGQALTRNGGGSNPLGYTQTTPAEIGAPWTTAVDIATPAHPISLVVISAQSGTSGIFPGGIIVGELLVKPSGFLLDIASGTHSFNLPNDPGLMGLCIATQGATVSALGQAHMNNAIDIVIGG